MNETNCKSVRAFGAVLVLMAGCHHPVVDWTLGALDAGTAPDADQGMDGGAGGGGAQVVADGDATCDQSQCLPETAVLTREGVSQLALSGPDELIAMGPMYSETMSLARVALATGAATHLHRDSSNPLDVSGTLRVQGEHVYLLTTWAGELWGIPARVRLSDGAHEELLTNLPSSGNPVERAHDVDASEYVFQSGGQLLRLPLSTVPGTASAFVDLSAGEQVADLRLGSTHVWWVSQTGLWRAARQGGAPELLQAGAFTRLRLAGDEVWVCGAGGLGRWTAGSFVPLTTTPVEDFALARGSWFVAVRSGTTAQVLDALGAVVLEDADAAQGRPLSLEVTATRVALGTGTRLVVKSSAQPVATCGCSRPTLTFPEPSAACVRGLCSGGQRAEGLSGGAFVGGALYGVFHDTQSFDPKLKRVSAETTAGAALVFDLTSTQPSVVGDSSAVFAIASGGLWAVDVATDTTRLVLADAWTPGAWQAHPAPMLGLDATHVYLVDVVRGVGRVLRSGGPWEQLLPSSAYVDGLRLDATHLYVSQNNTLIRLPKGGGAVEVLATGLDGEAGLGLSSGHAYFHTARGVERVRVGGGHKSLVLSAAELGVTRLSHLEVEGRDLHFVSFRTGDQAYRLERLDLATGERETVLTAPTATSLRGAVISAEGFALGGSSGSSYRRRGCCP